MKPPDSLNVFQRLARQWDAVYPYNAAQACLVAGQPDGSVEKFWHTSTVVRELCPREDLSRHFTSELNGPFADVPFRPFIQRRENATWFGIAYQHWRADGVSIRRLLGRWVGQEASDHTAVAVTRTPNLASALALLRRYGEYRRVRKVHTMGPLDYPVRVYVFDIVSSVAAPLLTYARRQRVKLNDVFVAALCQACDRLVPSQRRSGRHDIAVSSIVDLRPYLTESERRNETLVCHLGFTSAVCPARDVHDWDRLLGRVASEHRPQRDGRHGPPGMLWMRAANLASRFSRPERLYDFYRKEAPFAGGISNVNLAGTWVGDGLASGKVLDYLRVSPTGPMVPLAMNVTSLGDDLRITMTYRAALFNDWTAKEFGEMFIDRLKRISESV